MRIRRIPINLELEDRYIWYYDRMRKYTVKSGYKVFMKSKICVASSSSNLMGRVWDNVEAYGSS